MEIDDNELTSLTWLHSINILPQRSNNVSSKRRNDKSKLHHTKKSSEKKHTSDIGTSHTNCTKNDNLSLKPAQMLHTTHTIISSSQNNDVDTPIHDKNLKKSSDTIEENEKVTSVIDSVDLKKNKVAAEEEFLQWRMGKQWRNRSNPGKNY